MGSNGYSHRSTVNSDNELMGAVAYSGGGGCLVIVITIEIHVSIDLKIGIRGGTC